LDRFASPERRHTKLLRRLPLKTIVNTPEGREVRVSGRTSSLEGGVLEAPITGRKCVAWRVEVRRHSGKSSHRILLESDSRDFAIDDDTGRAIVDGTVLDLMSHGETRGTRFMGRAQTPRLDAFLKLHGIETEGVIRPSFSYTERLIEEGQLVTVAGSCTRGVDSTGRGKGYRGDGRLLRVGSLTDGSLPVTTDPGLSK
jgi:hypothetical protein